MTLTELLQTIRDRAEKADVGPFPDNSLSRADLAVLTAYARQAHFDVPRLIQALERCMKQRNTELEIRHSSYDHGFEGDEYLKDVQEDDAELAAILEEK